MACQIRNTVAQAKEADMMTYKSRTKSLKFHPTASRGVDPAELVMRMARAEDAAAVAQLAALDSAAAPSGPVLLAEVGGRPWAAIAIDGSREAIADPFRPSAELVGLLRMRAEQIAGSRPSRAAHRLAVLRPQRAA
jgi:hypothetical protein